MEKIKHDPGKHTTRNHTSVMVAPTPVWEAGHVMRPWGRKARCGLACSNSGGERQAWDPHDPVSFPFIEGDTRPRQMMRSAKCRSALRNCW